MAVDNLSPVSSLRAHSYAAPNTVFPTGVRIAASDDRQRLIDFLHETHRNEGRMFGSVDPDAIELMVDRAISRDRVIFGIIVGPDGVVEAALGLQPTKPWWGGEDSWYWTEVVLCVGAAHRQSDNFSKLMKFARWFQETAGAPVIINVQPEVDLGRKMRAFSRKARLIGGIFAVRAD